MSWVRFHACCRRSLARHEDDLGETLSYFNSMHDVDLIGWPPAPDSLPARLMKALANLEREERSSALRIYASLDLDDLARGPAGLIRSVVYLLVLSLCLTVMVSVFTFYVMPSMIAFHDSTLSTVPEFSRELAGAMPLVMIAVSLLSIGSVAAALKLNSALRGIGAASDYGWLGWLLPRRFREQHVRLEDLVCLPIPGFGSEGTRRRLSAWLEHRCLGDELPGLIRVQSARLEAEARSFAMVLFGVLAATILACISTFLVGMYLPIFKMGTAL